MNLPILVLNLTTSGNATVVASSISATAGLGATTEKFDTAVIFPAGALLDELGNPILDENGQAILDEGGSSGFGVHASVPAPSIIVGIAVTPASIAVSVGVGAVTIVAGGSANVLAASIGAIAGVPTPAVDAPSGPTVVTPDPIGATAGLGEVVVTVTEPVGVTVRPASIGASCGLSNRRVQAMRASSSVPFTPFRAGLGRQWVP